ncbi:hypothetical protein CANARDRAFT_27640 [[Candida] arabinofermentans NRRL YB-2248]|uniref:Uncharacterized protein n=1 Tax=[Candida] arabinofermentans NRRL YB-2248 TaxID=983967 RepID=A0A1E4T3U1_9ASCO|nr:hypothetical protein CANARDRAFT_27640 [[Candida] arabinofermentans NRRL YB-2248]
MDISPSESVVSNDSGSGDVVDISPTHKPVYVDVNALQQPTLRARIIQRGGGGGGGGGSNSYFRNNWLIEVMEDRLLRWRFYGNGETSAAINGMHPYQRDVIVNLPGEEQQTQTQITGNNGNLTIESSCANKLNNTKSKDAYILGSSTRRLIDFGEFDGTLSGSFDCDLITTNGIDGVDADQFDVDRDLQAFSNHQEVEQQRPFDQNMTDFDQNIGFTFGCY